MKIALNGSNGFVGKYLTTFFTNQGHEVITIPRKFYNNPKQLQEILKSCDGAINLAGASISKKWTSSYKKTMCDSRVETTKHLVKAINSLEKPLQFFISTSAVGIYEAGKEHNESSQEFDEGFLGNLAKEWEQEALHVKQDVTKVSIFRFGVVLGDGGAMGEMLPIFKAGLGGILGDGKQDFSWIHIEDLAKAYKFVIENSLKGVFNLTAPHPITNKEFTKNLGQALGRPIFFKVPPFALKLKFGEGATILLDGQKVYPKALLEEGFTFEHTTIQEALEDIV